MIFRLGELFCGPGGLALGALSAKVTCGREEYSIAPVWANDYDKDTCATYKHNICRDESSVVFCRDVRKLDMKKLSGIDALTFGFPCNDFSMVGEQKGMDGLYGPLYGYGIKALKHFQPKWFLAENVAGLKHANDGKIFAKIISEMCGAGYNVVPHLYKFEHYGVPQARHRIIIVGIREDIGLSFHVPDMLPNAPLTCRGAIENPPIPSSAPNQEFTNQAVQVVERLKYIKPGQNAFTADLPEALRLKVNGAKLSQIYKRLDPNKPAYTITGSGGGGTHVYHWKENRALTNRERARLQTFPDSFLFVGSKESVRKQIGMAVPSKGIMVIFEAILKTFANIAYRTTSSNLIHVLNKSDDAKGVFSKDKFLSINL
ncbi:MAG: DNA cytosine methyltransferase [Deltaproteobacteria bacterium]|nr:DNA cytosine methyltransferase [Deltaproteobacteria bacterium]